MKEKQSIIKFLILAVILAVALTAGFATGAMKTAALTADWTLSLRAICVWRPWRQGCCWRSGWRSSS